MNEDNDTIEIEITDEQFIMIAKMAHEKDITFNKMIEEILREQIENKN